MNTFIKAQTTKDNLTENLMPTNSTTDSFVLDLFADIGALRGKDKKIIITKMYNALQEDPLLATKVLYWARDIRGGAGERNTFRVVIQWMAETYPDIFLKNLHLIPVYGRWDDILAVIGINDNIDKYILGLILGGLGNKQTAGLVAKWMPREKSSKKAYAVKLRKLMGLNPKEYRKLLATNSNTVEDLMCANNWDKIDYEKLPSYAMNKYNKAFKKHSANLFDKYMTAVKEGTKSIKSTTLYPYDLVKKSMHNRDDVANEQWKALPNYMEGIKGRRIMPIIDTSGSMLSGEGSIVPMLISISLGLYISERNEGPFKDWMYIFSAAPELIKVGGTTLSEKISSLPRINAWNTNIELVFTTMLNKAVEFNAAAEDMPTHILIISDLEFDECVATPKATAMEMIKFNYEKNGFELPKIIFWNVNVKNDSKNQPVKMNDQGVALVSGASAAIMKSVLTGEIFTPYDIMLHTINSDRYKNVTI